MSLEDTIGKVETAGSNIFKRTWEHGLVRSLVGTAALGLGAVLGYGLTSPSDPVYLSAAAAFVGAGAFYLGYKVLYSIPDHIYTIYEDVKDFFNIFSKRTAPAH